MKEHIAKFKKVSLEQYKQAWANLHRTFTDKEIEEEWENIQLPVRATCGSAGYDFFLPKYMHFSPNVNSFFPTGIRCEIVPGWVLMIVPKSGLGNKHGTRLLNTTGVIDEDYYYSDNEGHIMVGMSVDRPLALSAGSKIVQGLFLPFGITIDDNVGTVRNGGFGSTGV